MFDVRSLLPRSVEAGEDATANRFLSAETINVVLCCTVLVDLKYGVELCFEPCGILPHCLLVHRADLTRCVQGLPHISDLRRTHRRLPRAYFGRVIPQGSAPGAVLDMEPAIRVHAAGDEAPLRWCFAWEK